MIFSRLLAEYQAAHPPGVVQQSIHGYDAAPLERAFGSVKAEDLTERRIVDYAIARQKEGASADRCNAELRSLSWVLGWACETKRLARRPVIEFLPPEERDRPTHTLPYSRVEMALGSSPRRELITRITAGPLVGSRPSPAAAPAQRNKTSGAITVDMFEEHVRAHPGALSDRERARLFTPQLGYQPSRFQIKRVRNRAVTEGRIQEQRGDGPGKRLSLQVRPRS